MYDSIFDHGLDDQCQFRGDLNAGHSDENIFNTINFYGDIYGDINGYEYCESCDEDKEEVEIDNEDVEGGGDELQ